MDPLSDILALLKLRSFVAGGLSAAGDWRIDFPAHEGVKFRAVLKGSCWIRVDGVEEPFLARAGDCFLLARGCAFSAGTRLDIPAVDLRSIEPPASPGDRMVLNGGGDFLSIGGYFALSGVHAPVLLNALPPLVHVRAEKAKTVLRWCADQMSEEMRAPQAGGALIVQQLAQMLLVHALRAYLLETPTSPGWLSALTDRQVAAAITAIHAEPGRRWTVQGLARIANLSRTAFAVRFRERVGQAPIEYLTRWRMLLADERLRYSGETIATVAASLGYGSEGAFSAAFRRVMGAPPRRHARRSAAA